MTMVPGSVLVRELIRLNGDFKNLVIVVPPDAHNINISKNLPELPIWILKKNSNANNEDIPAKVKALFFLRLSRSHNTTEVIPNTEVIFVINANEKKKQDNTILTVFLSDVTAK